MNSYLETLKKILKVNQEILFPQKEQPHTENIIIQDGQNEKKLEVHTVKQEQDGVKSLVQQETERPENSVKREPDRLDRQVKREMDCAELQNTQHSPSCQMETESVAETSNYLPVREKNYEEKSYEEMGNDRMVSLPAAPEEGNVRIMADIRGAGTEPVKNEGAEMTQSSSGNRGGVYPGFDKPGRARGELQDVEEIDLLDLFAYYMSRLPLLIAAVLIGALCAGLFTHYFIPDRFTAVSRMYMISASSDSVINLSDLNLGTSLSNDYVELMKSRPILEEVIDSLGLEYTYEQLQNMVELGVVTGTRIVKISATSLDPYEAKDISNEIARVSKIQLPKVMDAPAPTIVEEAVLPEYKSSPSLKRNTVMGALAVLVFVLAILTVKYLLDDTIKTSEDVEKEFGIMPLTVIPEGTIKGLKKVEDTDKKSRFWYYKKSKKKKKKKKKKR